MIAHQLWWLNWKKSDYLKFTSEWICFQLISNENTGGLNINGIELLITFETVISVVFLGFFLYVILTAQFFIHT